MLGIKKILCSCAAICIAVSILSFSAFADELVVDVPNLPVWDGTVAESFAGGSGTADDPYLISNGSQLALLMQKINDTVKESQQTTEGEYYKLTADIVLNDVTNYYDWSAEVAPANEWIPGGAVANYIPKGFAGYLDGGNYDIIGMYINRKGQYNGLFGYIYDGQVKDLGIRYAYVNGGSSTAALTGYVRASSTDVVISNCKVTDTTVIGKNNVGALGGYVEAYTHSLLFDKCSVAGHSYVKGNDYVGGIGGLIVAYGINYSKDGKYAVSFTNCMNAASVSGKTGVGGIIGSSKDYVSVLSGSDTIALLIENCINNGALACSVEHIGSIAGTVGPIGREDALVVTNIINCFGNKDYNESIYGYTLSATDASNSSVITSTEMAEEDRFSAFDFGNTWSFVNGVPVIKVKGDALGEGSVRADDFIQSLAALVGTFDISDLQISNIDFDSNGVFDLADINKFIVYLRNKGARSANISAENLRIAKDLTTIIGEDGKQYLQDVFAPITGKVEQAYEASRAWNRGDIVALGNDGKVSNKEYGNVFTEGNIFNVDSSENGKLGYVKIDLYDEPTGFLEILEDDSIYMVTEDTVVTFLDKSDNNLKIVEPKTFASTSKNYRQNDDKNELMRVFLCVEDNVEEDADEELYNIIYAVIVRD